MSERRPFHRPQPRYWWARRPYLAYTLRELTGVAVALYGAILLAGLVCLWRGPQAFDVYRQVLASGWSLLVHLVLLAALTGCAVDLYIASASLWLAVVSLSVAALSLSCVNPIARAPARGRTSQRCRSVAALRWVRVHATWA